MYRLIFFTLSFFVVFSGEVLAQCFGGGCPSGNGVLERWGRNPGYYGGGYYGGRDVQRYDRAVPSEAVCRIAALESYGMVSVGTGVAISSKEDQCVVLTVRHAVRRVGQKVRVKWANGQTADGEVAVIGNGQDDGDSAVILVNGKAPGLAKVSEESLQEGSEVSLGGFGGDGVWRGWTGRVLGFTSDGMMIVSGGARQGDSGGPVWTEEGLVGLISMTDGGRTYCTSHVQLACFFAKRYLFPWNAWLDDRKDARKNGQTLPPERMPLPRGYERGELPPPSSGGPSQSQPPQQSPYYGGTDQYVLSRIGDVERRVLDLDKKVLSIENRLNTVEGRLGVVVDGKEIEGIRREIGDVKKKTEELHEGLFSKIRDTLAGWFAPIFGGSVLTNVIIGVIVFIVLRRLIRRDVESRVAKGDPLEVEKLLAAGARLTPWKWDDALVAWISKGLNTMGLGNVNVERREDGTIVLSQGGSSISAAKKSSRR